MEQVTKKGCVVSPVVVEGRAIARNFWGKAWCDNLERYSDYENRLPRGRTYVRNGSVVDLQIERGKLHAMVSGSEIYHVTIEIGTVAPARWKEICRDCLGSVGSLVELLQGKLSSHVMERVCREVDGLFPSPGEIKMKCSCPDWADMCKHVAAVLYGAGARLDRAPDLLFALRGVDRSELIASAGADLPMTRTDVAAERILDGDDVAALFGIEMAPAPAAETAKAKNGAREAAPKRRAMSSGVRPGRNAPLRETIAPRNMSTSAPVSAPLIERRVRAGSSAKSVEARTPPARIKPPDKTVRARAKAPGKAAPATEIPAPQKETTSPRRKRKTPAWRFESRVQMKRQKSRSRRRPSAGNDPEG
jgi:uncharacterized Zn finger protein